MKRIHATKVLLVGGSFDENGGKPSSIAALIFKEFCDIQACPCCGQLIPNGTRSINADQVDGKANFLFDVKTVNGGKLSDLELLVEQADKYFVILWFADVKDNSMPKIVNEIKEKNKQCILVTSKRNDKDKYSLSDIIYHAIGIKSNLVVEFKKEPDMVIEVKGSGGEARKDGLVKARVIDPLANVFIDFTDDMPIVGKVLFKRVKELLSFTRYGGFKKEGSIPIPDDEKFFEIVKDYATVFHDLVHHHPDATNRFFGNAAFRCERGFPSFKRKDEKGREIAFISGRNMDKRFVDKESFVPVELYSLPYGYYGDKKPSVDTPIQLRLYSRYKNIKYMIHAHVYIDGAPMTEHVIPCGALEEYDDIVKLFDDRDLKFIAINLRGHGSIVMVKNVKDLENIKYVPMDVPSVHADYPKGV